MMPFTFLSSVVISNNSPRLISLAISIADGGRLHSIIGAVNGVFGLDGR